ncbi:MAG: hypothetical protein RL412_1130 [Pseudomonadota bacterium]
MTTRGAELFRDDLVDRGRLVIRVTPDCRRLANPGEFVMQQLDPDAYELDEFRIGLLVVLEGLRLVHIDPGHGGEIPNDLPDLLGQLIDIGNRVRSEAVEKPLTPLTKSRRAERDRLLVIGQQELKLELTGLEYVSGPLVNRKHRGFGRSGDPLGEDLSEPVLHGDRRAGTQRSGQCPVSLGQIGERPCSGKLTFDFPEVRC